MIKLQKNAGQIDLLKGMLKGDAGGYYIPEVEDKVLNWIPSEEDMPAVKGANIEGPPGPKGDSGVYIGAEEPTDESLVWINPEGEASIDIATKGYVDEAIAAIETEDVDLSNYYTKEETDALIPSTSGLATEKYVDEKFNSIEIPEVDLSDYAKKSDIPDTSGFATKEEIPSLEGYAKTTDIPDTSGFATKEDIPSLDGYAKTTDIPDVSGFTTMAAVEAKGYQTEAQVNSLINTALGVIENGTY